MKGRGLYIAVGLFLVAAVAYATLDRNQPVAKAPTAQASPIVNIKSASVKVLVIRTAAGALTIQPGTTWSYSVCAPGADASTCPLQPADAVAAEAVVTAATSLRPTRVVFGAPEGLPAYGLETASGGEIDITPTSGGTIVILVGADAPDSASKYLRLKDSNNIDIVPRASVATVLGAVAKPPVVPTPSSSVPAASPAASPAAPAPSPSPS